MDERYYAHTKDGAPQSEWQTVRQHLNNVAALAEGFAAGFGAQDFARAVGLCHDLGKYSQKFQRRLCSAKERVDHSSAGGQALYAANENLLGKLAAFCVFGHHGGLPDGGEINDMPGEGTLCARLRDETIEDYSAYKKEISLPQLVPPKITARDGFSCAFVTRMVFSALVDADWLDTEAFCSGGTVDRGGFDAIPVLYERLSEHIKGFGKPDRELNKKRTEILKNCLDAAEKPPGIFTLTAPTGSGKTIASLAFALKHAALHGKKRVIYVIPYNTIIEQNASVFEGILGEQNVVQHHCGVDYDGDEINRKRWAMENWDAPVIVTSSVQFFESLFSCKPSRCRKLHNIAESVVIFDEAQMLPLELLRPCCRAISELAENCGATAVLATATQPGLNRYLGREPVEIVKDPQGRYDFFKRVRYEVLPGEIGLEALAEELKSHEQLLCVVNSRPVAQELFSLLPQEGSYHLSTLMYPMHRLRVLNEIRERLKRGQPCRTVSTSLIEAGVDVDFPVLYREKAGLDSIIQAAGRCNREGRHSAQASVARVFELEGRKYEKPEHAAFTYAARRNEDISSIKAVLDYFEQLFYTKGDDDLDKEEIIAAFNDKKSGLYPFRHVSEKFRMIDDRTHQVFVPLEEEAKALLRRLESGESNRRLFRRVQKYSVNLYDTDIKRLREMGALYELAGGNELLILANPEIYYGQSGVCLEPGGGEAICI